MSYATSPIPAKTDLITPTNPAPRDNRNLIYGLLIAALIGTWGYLIYDKSKTSDEITVLNARADNSDSARISLQTEYDDILRRNDSLAGSNVQLQGEMAIRQKEIETKKAEIRRELSRKDGDLSKARRLIGELKTQVNDLLAQVQQLTEENGVLTASNTQLTQEKDIITNEKVAVEQSLAATTEEKNRLNDVASTLHASNISIQAIDIRSGGREKESETAKRIDRLKITFQLDENRIASSGSKELYVIMIAPDGRVISSPSNNSGQFSTRENGERTFTSKVNTNYEQGKTTPVTFTYSQEQRFQEGQYKIEIYHNGFKIGEAYKTLKKGGIFS